MKLPNFLIVGAMKAGTTSIYEHLKANPKVYLPEEKEPNDLLHEEVKTKEGLYCYAKKFSGAPHDAYAIGEASTSYTKRPNFEGVAERARMVLGSDVKIIYITRDPIDRAISQYKHFWGIGTERRSVETAIFQDITYPAYSAYRYQIDPWIRCFTDENVLILSFEEYVATPDTSIAAILHFLGVEGEAAESLGHRNKSDGKRTAYNTRLVGPLVRSQLYLRRVKPVLPRQVIEPLKAVLLPRVKVPKVALSDDKREEFVRLVETWNREVDLQGR